MLYQAYLDRNNELPYDDLMLHRSLGIEKRESSLTDEENNEAEGGMESNEDNVSRSMDVMLRDILKEISTRSM